MYNKANRAIDLESTATELEIFTAKYRSNGERSWPNSQDRVQARVNMFFKSAYQEQRALMLA